MAAVRVHPTPLPGRPAWDGDRPDWAEAALPDDFGELLPSIGEALAYQNYERVYQLAYQALATMRDPEQEAQTRRLVGIAHAQLEDFAGAEREISRAAGLTADPAFGAHLQYLIGLIATKRVYDMDLALLHYQRGIEVLGPGPDDTAERSVERSWLLNGQALVMTLKAKQASSGEERKGLFEKAFALEFEAFDGVKNLTGAAPSYLRHNLLANLTFLLEVSRRFGEAVTFWRRAFERYLAADSHAFEATFNTRLGLLLFKAGQHDEGIAMLEKARSACTSRRGSPTQLPGSTTAPCAPTAPALITRGACGNSTPAAPIWQASCAASRRWARPMSSTGSSGRFSIRYLARRWPRGWPPCQRTCRTLHNSLPMRESPCRCRPRSSPPIYPESIWKGHRRRT
jgi:tetratricopeptide (TPR) repeat protein